MSSFRGAAIAVLAGMLLLALASWLAPASAHDWFKGMTNPNGGSCCDEAGDCKSLPPGSVDEVKGGFVVTLTKAQMAEIRPDLIEEGSGYEGPGGGRASGMNPVFKNLVGGIREFIPYADVQPGMSKTFAGCLGYQPFSYRGSAPRWISCFFAPSNT